MERIDYSSWPRINLSVLPLKLDKDNPRIPDYAPKKYTKDILDYLFANEKIEKLAQKIVEKGFINHDPIYVIKEGDAYVVVEGNRRVSALKCLLTPELAPTARSRRSFEKLKNRLGEDLIEKIEVYVAPSRREVQNVLFELHADGKLQWNRQQKNKFISSAGIESGESLEEIAQRFNVSVAEIEDSVQEYLFEQYFTQLGLPTDIEEQALHSSFSISNISRLVNSSLFKKSTGYRIEKNKLKTDISKNRFDFIISTFIKDLLRKKINSRTLNKSKNIDDYVTQVLDKAPESSPESSSVEFTPVTKEKNDENNNSATIKEPILKRKKLTLIPKDKNYDTGLQKLDMLIQEAQGLLIDTHKIAGALLLRTILELSVIRVFDINKCKPQCYNNKGRVNGLTENMKALVRREEWFIDKAYLNDLKRFIANDSSSWNSLESFNRYVHGEFTLPDRDLLQQAWLIIKPLIDMKKAS